MNAQVTLDTLAIGAPFRVTGVQVPEHAPEWAEWLDAMGFTVGEPVRLLTRAMPGGDPLVVRIGLSTFALRRAEAQCIQVAPDVESFL